MDQNSKSKSCAQDSALKLLAEFNQNLKIVNNVIAQLMKNFKMLAFFHCDVTDDFRLCARDAQQCP